MEKQYLSRNFILLSDLDNYYNLLIEKSTMAKKNIDFEKLNILFEKLKEINKNSDEYQMIYKNFKLFTEEFVLNNIDIFIKVLNLSEEEKNEILLESGYINEYNIFELINKMANDYKEILRIKIKEMIKFKNYDYNSMYDFSIDLENKENKELICYVIAEFCKFHPYIKKFPVLLNLFRNLNSNIGVESHKIAVEMINDFRSNDKIFYGDYKYQVISKALILKHQKRK